jgi:hypothetical protein
MLKDKPVEEKAKFEVSIRKWQYCSRMHEKDKDGFIYLDVEYSYEKGIEYNNKPKFTINH